MEQIRQYFENAIQQKISDKEWTFFVSKLSRQEFPKKHIILKTGQIEGYLSFVEWGNCTLLYSKIRKRPYIYLCL